MPNLTILNCPVSQGTSKFTAPLQRSSHKLPILHREREALKAAGWSDMIWHYSTQSPCKSHATEHARHDLFPTYSLTGPKTTAWQLQGTEMAANRNSIQLKDGQTHPEELWCIFHDLLWHGVLSAMLMDGHNHSDSNDSEESSKVLLKWYILYIHHYQRISFIVKNRVQQAVVPCIFLSITTAPASFLWNFMRLAARKEKFSSFVCYQDTRQHPESLTCKRNFYAQIWRKFPLKLWPAWIQASENISIHFTAGLKMRKTHLYVQTFKMKSQKNCPTDMGSINTIFMGYRSGMSLHQHLELVHA